MFGLRKSKAPVFQDVAREWWENFMKDKAVTANAAWERLEKDALPSIGHLSLSKIDSPTVLAILKSMQARGAVDSAYKVKSTISQVFRYAIACGLAFSNPARDLSFALVPKANVPRAALIDPKKVGTLMLNIDKYHVATTKYGIRMLALTFVRPGELRHAEWTEIDFDNAEWRIPAAKMKMRKAHIVPLSRQALSILKALRRISGESRYIFPQTRNPEKPMCNKRINNALRKLGYAGDIMCGHGFRAMASSLLSEQGWSPDAIERQLAHVEGNSVRAVYHRAEHLDERRKMMQAWANYLDKLRKAARKITENHLDTDTKRQTD
jgi:integrase